MILFSNFAHQNRKTTMNFFKKSQDKQPKTVINQPEETAQTPNETAARLQIQEEGNAMEDEVRHSTTTPDFVNTAIFQAMVREEAKRLKMREQILTTPHLARLQDALRLNETKMENIEDNLRRVHNQLERVRHYQEVTLELQDQKKHLYETNKQLASSINEREALDRFEEFENIQGYFQRLTMLEMIRREQMTRLSELSRTVDVAAKEMENERKRLQELQDETRDATRRMNLGIETANEAQLIEGRTAYITFEESILSDRAKACNSQRQALEKEIQECKKDVEKLDMKIGALRTRRQSLAPHYDMANHGELIIERLTKFAELETELAKTERQLTECRKKQSEENDMLGGIYTAYQQVLQDIQGLQGELQVHRQNNHGLDSYRLQERAMKLKLRRAMLQNAQSLWNRIDKGYSLIEESMQRINLMRLKLEPLSENIKKLSNEINILRHTTREKEYTFTLSKSQNVIQLRSDLKEGVNCTVCGAKHHPYHSDTMMEQNKLIGDIKMEYEALAAELRNKEKQLRELEIKYSHIVATKEETENTLITLRSLQNGYVQDWQIFSDLDVSFSSCDSTVNAAARTSMIRQLIENIGAEVETAQKELDTFNFHQQRINILTEQIALKEQKKNELITRLNEVNTGCQVMAGQLERVQTHKQIVRDNYSRMFETLDKMITLPDWQTTWNRSHESLLMNIQELTKECLELNETIHKTENKRKLQEMQLMHLKQKMEILLIQITLLDDDIKVCHDRINEDTQKLRKLIGNESSKTLLQKYMETAQTIKNKYDEQHEKAFQAEVKYNEAKGRLMENKEAAIITDERTVTERQAVDLWIRQYNANHPPVQYTELEEMFASEHNWNDIRNRIRAIQMEFQLTQARVDKLGSLLVALQAEGMTYGTDTDTIQKQLIAQTETLENRRRETIMQIAAITIQLNMHKKAEESIKEENMQEKR